MEIAPFDPPTSKTLPYNQTWSGSDGLMEFAGVDKAARSKMGVWKMQEWTYRHDVARVDIAGGKNVSKLA